MDKRERELFKLIHRHGFVVINKRGGGSQHWKLLLQRNQQTFLLHCSSTPGDFRVVKKIEATLKQFARQSEMATC